MSIRVTVEDLDNDGETRVWEVQDNYLLLTHGACEMTTTQHWPTTGKLAIFLRDATGEVKEIEPSVQVKAVGTDG